MRPLLKSAYTACLLGTSTGLEVDTAIVYAAAQHKAKELQQEAAAQQRQHHQQHAGPPLAVHMEPAAGSQLVQSLATMAAGPSELVIAAGETTQPYDANQLGEQYKLW